MAWQNYNQGSGYNANRIAYAPGSVDLSTRGELIAKVYGLLGLSILVSLPGIAVGWNNIEVFKGFSWFIFLLVWMGIVFAAHAVARTPVINVLMLLVTGFATGFIISLELAFHAAAHGSGILYQAFIMAIGVFGGLSAYAIISKRNFNFLYGFVSAGSIGLIVIWLLMMFGSAFGFGTPSLMYLIWCWLGLLVMSGLVLMKTSWMIRDGQQEDAVYFALALYMSFVNIFLFILRILSAGRD
jgi:modulator of FtsH protease